jgi:hypothetical protein
MSHTIRVGWQVLLDENEWDSDADVVIPAPEPSPYPATGKRSLRGSYTAGVLLLLTLAVGVRLWQQAQSGLAAVERGLSHTLSLESAASFAGDELLANALLDPQMDVAWRNQQLMEMAQADVRPSVELAITEIELYGDRAMAQVRVTDSDSGAIYRESRFYRETADGWLRSQPVPALWGEPRTLESEHFVFHFRRLDGAAVAEAAPVLDEAYMHMHAALGLPLPVAFPSQAKVEVRVVAGGESYGDPWYRTGNPLWINSPLLLHLPDQLTDSQALAELVAFPIRRALVNRAMSPLGKESQPSPEFVSGLRLWLAWEEQTLRADYRMKLVNWVYSNAPNASNQRPVSDPDPCDLLAAWQLAAEVVPISFYCSQDMPAYVLYLRRPTALSHLPLSISRADALFGYVTDPMAGGVHINGLGQVVAVATALEYATHIYGEVCVADLLQAAREGKSWHSAAKKVFGVSEAEFEAGWWAWLAEEYGVDTSEFIAAQDSSQPLLMWDPAAVRQALAEYQARLP